MRRAVLGEVNPAGRRRWPQLPARLFLRAPRAAAGGRSGPEGKGGTERHGRRGALPRSSNSFGRAPAAARARGCRYRVPTFGETSNPAGDGVRGGQPDTLAVLYTIK